MKCVRITTETGNWRVFEGLDPDVQYTKRLWKTQNFSDKWIYHSKEFHAREKRMKRSQIEGSSMVAYSAEGNILI